MEEDSLPTFPPSTLPLLSLSPYHRKFCNPQMMNRVFENTSSLFVAHLIGRLLSLVLTLLLMPRYFSEEELGSYFLAMFITNLIASVTELGMQAPLIREMTLHLQQARHFVGNALMIRLLLSVVAFGLMVGSGYLLGYPPFTLQLIQLLGLAEIFSSIAQLFRCVFRAFERMKYEAFTVVAERLVIVLVGGWLILRGIGLASFRIIVLIASVLNLLLCVGIVLKKLTSLRFQFNLAIWRTLMCQAFPFAFGNIFNLIYFRIDTVLLSKLSPDGVAANAWYGLAYTIVNAFTILPGAFMGAMFPVMSRAIVADSLHESADDDFRPIYTYALRWMVLIGIPFTVGMATLSTEISLTFFPTYGQTTIAPALGLLSWSGGLIFLTTVIITVLRAADKSRAFTFLMGTTALLNIGLNFILIPRFSHVGAAATMIISEGYLFIAGFIYISRKISKPIQTGFVIKAISVSALMWVGLMLLRHHLAIWLLIPLAIVFYFAGIAILGEIRWVKIQK